MTQKSRVVFSFDKEEIMPTFLGWGHGLKEENICLWETVSCENILNGRTKIYMKRAVYKNMIIDISLIYELENGYDTLKKGILKVDNKECNIIDLRCYQSLQIGQFCYDNISVIKLPYNVFESTRMSTNGASIDARADATGATRVANMVTAPEISS